MQKLRIIKFWCVAMYHIIKESMNGNEWHRIYIDIDNGEDENGKQKRKQLIADRGCDGFNVRWQDLSELFGK